eukprot:1543694-Pleurochrysis_carterae.AAC.1
MGRAVRACSRQIRAATSQINSAWFAQGLGNPCFWDRRVRGSPIASAAVVFAWEPGGIEWESPKPQSRDTDAPYHKDVAQERQWPQRRMR